MKIKSFQCPKSIRNYEKKILGTSDAWSTSCLSYRPSEPVYYIVDCRISKQACTAITYIFHVVDSIAANALLDWYSGAYSQSYSNTRRYQSIGVTEAGLEVYTYMYIGFTAHTASRCIWKI